jgi:hypothetical protein
MDSIDVDNAPAIILGGKKWLIPLLSAKQNKLIDPLILSLLPVFSQWESHKSEAISKLGSEQYNALLEIAFQAIRRAQPDETREQFMERPVTLPELVAAFPIIAQQTGIFQKTSPAMGEAVAGNGL